MVAVMSEANFDDFIAVQLVKGLTHVGVHWLLEVTQVTPLDFVERVAISVN